MARILRGAPVAAAINETTAASLAALQANGVTPVLALVRVGENGADAAYARSAVRRCQALGAQARCLALPADITQTALEDALDALSRDDAVHGILLFQPLPKHLDAAAACAHLGEKLRQLVGKPPVKMRGFYLIHRVRDAVDILRRRRKI